MIKSLSSIAVVVSNGKKAARWYKEKLGLQTKSVEGHWVTVAPKRSKVEIHLCQTKKLEPGNTGIAFMTDDLKATHQELRRKGVTFTTKPTKEDWGFYAMFKDPDENEFWLFQA